MFLEPIEKKMQDIFLCWILPELFPRQCVYTTMLHSRFEGLRIFGNFLYLNEYFHITFCTKGSSMLFCIYSNFFCMPKAYQKNSGCGERTCIFQMESHYFGHSTPRTFLRFSSHVKTGEKSQKRQILQNCSTESVWFSIWSQFSNLQGTPCFSVRPRLYWTINNDLLVGKKPYLKRQVSWLHEFSSSAVLMNSLSFMWETPNQWSKSDEAIRIH